MNAGRHTGSASYLSGVRGQNRPGIHVPITGDASNLERALNKTNGMLGKFGKQLGGLGMMVAGAFSIQAIGRFTVESVRLASTIEGIKHAFDKIEGQHYLEGLREATRGTVDDLQLMRNVVRASNFKIPVEQLGKAFEFATKRAAQTGDSVQYLVESLILGVGRKSPLILDNLGISAVELRKKLKGVGVESASVGEVMSAMMETIDEELIKMGDVPLTAAQKFEQLRTSITNVQLAWGNLFKDISADLATGPLFKSLKGIEIILRSIKNYGVQLPGRIATLELEETKGAEAAQEKLEQVMALFNKTTQEAALYLLPLWQDELDKAKKGLENFQNSTIEASDALGKKHWQKQLALAIGALDYLKPLVYETADGFEDLGDEVEGAAEKARKAALDFIKLFQTVIKGTGPGKAYTFGDVTAANVLTEQQQQIADALLKVGEDYMTGMRLIADEEKLVLEERTGNIKAFYQGLDDMFSNSARKSEESAMIIQSMFNAIGNAIGDSLGELIRGEKKFGDFIWELVGEVLSAAFSIIGASLAQSAAAGFAGGASVGGPLAPVTGTAVAAATVGAFLAAVPSIVGFAEGGMVYGPTLGLMGEYAGASTNPEVIAPLNKLQSMIGGGQVVRIDGEFRIRGEDIYYVMKKQERKQASYK